MAGGGSHISRVGEVCSRYSEQISDGGLQTYVYTYDHQLDFGLDYVRGDGVSLVGYTDSDWAGCAADRKSTSGCCFSLGSGLVSWFNRKQKSVALSSAEAEYMAASLASSEAIWLRKMLVGLFGQEMAPTVIHCDN